MQIQKLADRIMDYSAEDAGIKFSGFDPRFSEEENKISMVMKLIQTFSIHVVEEEIDAILQEVWVAWAGMCSFVRRWLCS